VKLRFWWRGFGSNKGDADEIDMGEKGAWTTKAMAIYGERCDDDSFPLLLRAGMGPGGDGE
jgi:hypothetical protein